MSGLFQMDELSIKAEEAEQRADKAEFKVSLLFFLNFAYYIMLCFCQNFAVYD